MGDTAKRTCFSCAEVHTVDDRHDICYCLFGVYSMEDAELIYEPMGGTCPAWNPLIIDEKEAKDEPE